MVQLNLYHEWKWCFQNGQFFLNSHLRENQTKFPHQSKDIFPIVKILAIAKTRQNPKQIPGGRLGKYLALIKLENQRFLILYNARKSQNTKSGTLWPYLLSQCISVLEFAEVRDFLSAFQRLYQGSIDVTVSVSIVTSLWRNRQRYDSVDSHLKQNATEWKFQVVLPTSLRFKTNRRDGSRVATPGHSVNSAWSLRKRWTYKSTRCSYLFKNSLNLFILLPLFYWWIWTKTSSRGNFEVWLYARVASLP